jgi:hypothetical protein
LTASSPTEESTTEDPNVREAIGLFSLQKMNKNNFLKWE